MISQALFSSKDKSRKLKCRLLQFLFGALRVKMCVSKIFTEGSTFVTSCLLLWINKTLLNKGQLIKVKTLLQREKNSFF